MEGSETSVEKSPLGRGALIFVGIVTALALAPVAGMVLAFAILPALPIVLAIGLVLGPINWVEDRMDEAELRRGTGGDEQPRAHLPLREAHA